MRITLAIIQVVSPSDFLIFPHFHVYTTLSPLFLTILLLFPSVVQFSRSVVPDSLWPHESQHARPPCPSPTPRVHTNPCPLSLLKLMPIESVMPSSHLILCRFLLFLPPVPPSIRVFSNEATLRMSWPKYWSFSFSISPSNEHPGLISFRMDWFYLLAVQGTLKSSPTPQFKRINFSVLSFLSPSQFPMPHSPELHSTLFSTRFTIPS